MFDSRCISLIHRQPKLSLAKSLSPADIYSLSWEFAVELSS